MKLIVEGTYFLEKFTGKGGWTFVKFPEIILSGSKAYGMMKVSGFFDSYAFEDKHLMPMGNGQVFIPLAKSVRKIIGKEEGDPVYIKLFQEEIPSQIPEELIACLQDDPGKWKLFQELSSEEQSKWINYIYQVDDLDRRSSRIIRLLQSLN